MAINLLPEIEKKERELASVQQKLFSAFIFVSIFLVFFIVLLFSLEVYLNKKTAQLQNAALEKERELQDLKFHDFKNTTNQINQNLAEIQKFSKNQIFLTPLLEKLSVLTPPQIYFTSFSFQKRTKEFKEEESGELKKETFADFYISGWADRRETLFLFKKNLEKEKEFKELHFAPVSWVFPSDVEFSFSFQIKIQ